MSLSNENGSTGLPQSAERPTTPRLRQPLAQPLAQPLCQPQAQPLAKPMAKK